MFAYNNYALIMFIVGAMALGLAGAIASRRPGRGVIPFVFVVVSIAFWSFMHGVELMATTIGGKLIFGGLTYPGITGVVASLLVFVWAYTGRESWITRRNVGLLLIEPSVLLLAVGTSRWHGLIWAQAEMLPGTTTAVYVQGWLFWVHAIYSYGLLAASTGLLIQAFIRNPDRYRGQITALLIAQSFPWIANVVRLSGGITFPYGIDPTALGFALTIFVTGWNLYRYQLMDVTPVAHHMVFNSMQDAVFVFDERLRIMDANLAASKLLMRDVSAIIGQSADTVFTNRLILDALYGRDAKPHTDTREFSIEFDQREHIFDMRFSPIYNQSGVKRGMILTLYDITALIKTNRELEAARIKADEASRLKSEFLATMSHELRTPLNAILGYASLLEMGIMGELTQEARESVGRMNESGKHLLRLIDDVLNLAKIEAGRIDIQMEPFKVRGAFHEWQSQMVGLAIDKSLSLTVDVDPDLPPVICGDFERLSQVVINLMGNAVKFTEAGGITLRGRVQDADHWQIEVIDTGVGIPPEARAYIFDEFRQVDGSSQRAHGGTGLGLAIVARLVQHMNGAIMVESEVGKGSRFVVTLPLEAVGDHGLA